MEKMAAGNQILCAVLIFCGVTVVYDEIDNGIHDLLLKNILESIVDHITEQLIITTHNTYMLETINPKSAYVINVDYQRNTDVKSLDQFTRIQGTNNPRIMYLKGLFGGVPMIDTVDYDSILQELTEDESEEKGGRLTIPAFSAIFSPSAPSSALWPRPSGGRAHPLPPPK